MSQRKTTASDGAHGATEATCETCGDTALTVSR